MKGFRIYENGEYHVSPLIVGYVVKDQSGRVIYPARDLEDAVQTCDEIADGVAA